MSTIRTTIETAMARIGCPPGDNADADLYRDLQKALAALSRLEASAGKPVVPSPAPVELSEEDIERMAQKVWEQCGWGGEVGCSEGNLLLSALRHITKHYTLTPKQP